MIPAGDTKNVPQKCFAFFPPNNYVPETDVSSPALALVMVSFGPTFSCEVQRVRNNKVEKWIKGSSYNPNHSQNKVWFMWNNLRCAQKCWNPYKNANITKKVTKLCLAIAAVIIVIGGIGRRLSVWIVRRRASQFCTSACCDLNDDDDDDDNAIHWRLFWMSQPMFDAGDQDENEIERIRLTKSLCW